MFTNLKTKIQQKLHKHNNNANHQDGSKQTADTNTQKGTSSSIVQPVATKISEQQQQDTTSVPFRAQETKPIVVSVHRTSKDEVAITDETDMSNDVFDPKSNLDPAAYHQGKAASDPNKSVNMNCVRSPTSVASSGLPSPSALPLPPAVIVCPRFPQLARDLERYYFGASYAEVNYVMLFLQERGITQFPSSVYGLAAAYPPLANTMLVLSDESDESVRRTREENSDFSKNFIDTRGRTCSSSFDFLTQNALAFTQASVQGMIKAFLVGNSLSQLLGMASPTNAFPSSPTCSPVPRPSCISPTASNANGNATPLSVLSSPSGGGGRFSHIPRNPFWFYQTAYVELPINVALGRDRPMPPDSTMTPAQFWALQQQLPLHCQRKRWRQIYNSRDHGFNIGVMKRLSQDQLKYVDRPCVLIMSVQTPDQSQKELATAIQLAAQPCHNNELPEGENKKADKDEDIPRYRPPTIVGAFFTGGPFKDGCQRKYFGQEGTFVFRSLFPKEEAELEEEEARKVEINQLREQKIRREKEEKAERERRGDLLYNPFDSNKKKSNNVVYNSTSPGENVIYSPQLAEPMTTEFSESDLFQTRARGFSFAPAPRLVPPIFIGKEADEKEGVDRGQATNERMVKPNFTLSVSTEALVRDATEPPLTDYDFNLKFFKIPPRDDGPELELQVRHGAPTSSAFGAMLKLLRKKISGQVSVVVTPVSSAATTPRHQSPVLCPSNAPSASKALSALEVEEQSSPALVPPTMKETTVAGGFQSEEPKETIEEKEDFSTPAQHQREAQTPPVIIAQTEKAQLSKSMSTQSNVDKTASKERGIASSRDNNNGTLLETLMTELRAFNAQEGIPNVDYQIDIEDGDSSDVVASKEEAVSIALLQSLFPPFQKLATRPNDYFIRYTDQQLFCGGGGEGPAILMSEDLAKCTSAPNCDTFGARKAMKEAKAEDDAIAKRLSLLLKILARVEEAPTLPKRRKATKDEAQVVATAISAQASASDQLQATVAATHANSSRIAATEEEMDAFIRIIHHYAATLQHRRSRSIKYYFDQALFSGEWSTYRRALLLPTLQKAFDLQQEEQKILIENDLIRQRLQQTLQVSDNEKNSSPTKISSPLSPEGQVTSQGGSANNTFNFTQRSASTILAQTLNTINDASGPFSPANLDAFFAQSETDTLNSAELHFEQQIVVECGMAEAQIQTIELWEITEDTF